MMSKIISGVAILVIGLLQISFLSTWPPPVSSINLILVLVIFLIALNQYQPALWWAFGGGVLFELFSLKPFGTMLLSLLVTAAIINFLFTNFFTNYSFYSLTVLCIIGTISYNVGLIFGQSLGVLLGVGASSTGISLALLLNIGWQIFFHLVILYVLFFIFHLMIGRLRLNVSGANSFSINRLSGF